MVSSDEAIFSLTSEVNIHNVIRYARYGQEHPQDHHIGNRQGSDQVLVWVGLNGNGEVFGPHFVRGNLDTREYLRIVRYNVIQQDFARQNINRSVTLWQQGGEPANTSNTSINYLRERFQGTAKSCNHKRMQEHTKTCNSTSISCYDSEMPEMYKCRCTCFC